MDKNEIDGLKNELEQANNEVQELISDLETVKHKLFRTSETDDQTIRRLRSEVDDQERKIVDLEYDIRDRDQTISRLEDEKQRLEYALSDARWVADSPYRGGQW